MHSVISATHDKHKLYTPSDVANILGNHPSACVRWIQRGVLLKDGSRVRLNAIRVPGAWRVAPADLEAFLEVIKADVLKPDDDAPAATKVIVATITP